MSLTRAQLVAALVGELGEVLDPAQLAATDTTGAMKEPVDRTLRAMGVADASLATATVATGAEAKAIAYGLYFTLWRATNALVGQMDVGSAGASAKLRQQFENVRDRMKEALRIAQGYGLTVASEGYTGIDPVPYVGGITATDFDAVSGIMPPLFDITTLDIPGVYAITDDE